MNRPASTEWLREAIGPLLVLAAGLIAFSLFPDNLALLTRIVVAAFLVLSLDLLVGFCGIVSIGQAALFGAGAYAAAIACRHGITEPFSLIAVGIAAGAAAGLAMGMLMLRARGLPQLVLSIAIVQLFHETANKASFLTGGSDGLSGFKPDAIFGLFAFDLWGRTAYGLALGCLVAALIVMKVVVTSPFGMVCRGIKDDPVRIASMGIFVRPALLRMFVLSGAVAGLGGALAALSTEVVGLDSVGFNLSADALVMLALGGIGTLYGAIAGAILLIGIEHGLSALDPFYWMAVAGLLLIARVLFSPRDIKAAVQRFVRQAA